MLKTLPAALTASLGIALAAATGASAATFSYTGNGGAIPDLSTFQSSIVVTDNFIIDDVSALLSGLSHTWVGDLTATLTHEASGTSASLFNRPGRVGNIGVGDSSNLGGNYNFNDAFSTDIATAATAGGGSYVIPSGDYKPFNPFSVFVGLSSQSTWTLSIADQAGGDTGSLGSWQLSLEGDEEPTSVPEPASLLGLLAVGAMGAGSALKRKQGQKA